MKKILALSELAKAYLIIISVIPFYLSYIAWGEYVLFADPMPGKIYLERLEGTISDLWLAVVINLALIVLGALIRYLSWPLDKLFRQVSLTFTVLFLTYSGHLIGVFSITSGIVLMSATILGLILFELTFVVVLSTFTTIALFGSCFLASLGYIEYSPIFVGGPTGGEHPDMFWVVSITSFSIPFILTFFIFSALLVRQWKIYDEEILKLASVDPLTQLSNRRFLMDSFKRELAIHDRQGHDESSISCIILDLDHFKQVNDVHGHQMGDDVLVEAAKALQGCIREYDIVGRYGGEEFLIVLPRTGLDTAGMIAERCREKITELEIPLSGNQVLKVTASFGVASFDMSSNCSISDMIKVADEALYEAKETGRDRVVAVQGTVAA